MASGKKGTAEGERLVCRNARATQRYEIEERLEAGLVLTGSEVKSIRAGKADLDGSFARIVNDEVFLYSMYIAPYGPAQAFGHDPRAVRKLLMHAREIEKWKGRITQRGYSLVPLRIYFKNGRVKLELGLGKGKKEGDEREKIKREVDLKEAREIMQARRGRR